MFRSLANSFVFAVLIAVVLSFLPNVQLLHDGDVTVFQPDNPTALTEESLVDLLSLNKLEKFDYRHVEWSAAQSTLEVEFVTNGHPEKGYVGDEWYRFASNVFQSTTNVENLICHLYDSQGNLLAELEVDDRLSEREKSQGTRAEDYLEEHFHFRFQN